MDSALKPVLAVASLPPGLPENAILTANTSQNNSQGLIHSSMAQSMQAGSFQVSQQTSMPTTSTTTQSKQQAAMSLQFPGLPPGTVLVPQGNNTCIWPYRFYFSSALFTPRKHFTSYSSKACHNWYLCKANFY